jgi:hypothetical protein
MEDLVIDSKNSEKEALEEARRREEEIARAKKAKAQKKKVRAVAGNSTSSC